MRVATYHPLPQWVEQTHGVLNIQSFDKKCFVYSYLATLFPDQVRREKYRASSYQRLLNDPEIIKMFAGLPEPMTLKDIGRFTKNNPDISVNVYTITNAEQSTTKNGTPPTNSESAQSSQTINSSINDFE